MSRTTRWAAPVLAVFLLASLSVTGGETSAAPLNWKKVACSLPKPWIQRVYDGYHPQRSGEVQFLPKFPNYIGQYYSHSGPWPYLQEVPLLLYGPGHVPSVGTVKRQVTVADMAPTYADYLDFPFEAPNGKALTEAIDPAATTRPKLIFTLVWDGGGRNVMKAYPKNWPNLKRFMREGAWFENATVGSSPSLTPAIHTTLGTGAFPRIHGIVDLRFRQGAGPPSGNRRLDALAVPTLADVYDVANQNAPVIGQLGAEGTLGMIGHGSMWEGGDEDISAAQRGGKWGLSGYNDQFFAFPSYVEGVPGYNEVKPQADRQDGRVDGRWFDLQLDSADSLTYTPAYTHYQTGVVEELIKREGFGADDITDMLFVNYKIIDKVGHRYSFPSGQMSAAVRAADTALKALVEVLNRTVGQGQWVLALTADHGFTPKASTTGATVIDNAELARDLKSNFKGIQAPRATQTWVSGGSSPAAIARYLMNYTGAENRSGPPGERLFAAAFPSSVLGRLPCVKKD